MRNIVFFVFWNEVLYWLFYISRDSRKFISRRMVLIYERHLWKSKENECTQFCCNKSALFVLNKNKITFIDTWFIAVFSSHLNMPSHERSSNTLSQYSSRNGKTVVEFIFVVMAYVSTSLDLLTKFWRIHKEVLFDAKFLTCRRFQHCLNL